MLTYAVCLGTDVSQRKAQEAEEGQGIRRCRASTGRPVTQAGKRGKEAAEVAEEGGAEEEEEEGVEAADVC